METATPRTIVLLGIGHTNAHIVRRWIAEPIPDCRLVCVSLFPTATYSGMLPGTLAGQFTDAEMRIDLVALAERAGAEFVRGHANGLDLEAGQLLFADREPLSFDVLSIGVGSKPAGIEQHRGSGAIVAIKPMQTFLTRLDARIDQATGAKSDERDEVNLAIVGGGVAGVEIAMCLRQHVARAWPNRRFDIRIHHNGDRVAEGLRPRTVRLIESILRKRHIKVDCNSEVTEVRSDSVVTSDGREHAADAVIWATGAAPPDVLATLPLEKDARGFLATTPTLQSKTDRRIFAVGDCGTITSSPSPKAGVYAVRQSPILWHNIGALLRGEPLKRYRPQSDYLKLINTGKRKAVLEYGWLSWRGGWCWHLKTWIDKRFISAYQLESPPGATEPLALAGAESKEEQR
jgi:pyridine nucleotide-disulfide oxidoreductase family protein